MPTTDPDALFKKALLLHQSGDVAAAIEIYRRLMVLFPENAQLLFLLGTAESKQGNYLEGADLLERSIAISPDNPQAHNNRGIALRSLKRFDEALKSYDRAIELKPDYAEAYGNKSVVLQDLQKWDEALRCCDQAIQFKPDHAEAYNNKGSVLRKLRRLDEALQSYDRALELRPRHAEIHSNRGVVLQDLRRLDEALQSYDRAIGLDPGYAPAYWHKALLKILTGDFVEGWKLYEWRWKGGNQRNFARNFPQPLWLGNEPLAGKTILIHAEQALGDTIQFCRYLPMVEKAGAKVIFEVPGPLVPLAATLKCSCVLVEAGQQLPHFDLHCPLISLPLAFKTTLKTIPSGVPYLYADAQKRAVWKEKLGRKNGLRVGLAWSGSATNPSRSIEFGLLRPLLGLPVEFHSLQKEYRQEDKALLGSLAQIKDHHRELIGFSDTAALISALDLVVSIDTSVAHLAGALGKTVWVLLPFASDYRWLLDRSDSPWYPSATLFRQSTVDDWSDVILQVARRLEGLL